MSRRRPRIHQSKRTKRHDARLRIHRSRVRLRAFSEFFDSAAPSYVTSPNEMWTDIHWHYTVNR